MSNYLKSISVSIANGGSLSGAVDLYGTDLGSNPACLVGIEMPADWTTAGLTFQTSMDGTTYNNVYDAEGTEVTVAAADDRYILLNPAAWAGFRYLKIRSGTAGTPVNQGAARTINAVVRGAG